MDLLAAVGALNPPPQSGNDAFRRVGGRRAAALAAYRLWSQGLGTGGAAGTREPLREPLDPANYGAPGTVIPARVDDAAERERARVAAWWGLDQW